MTEPMITLSKTLLEAIFDIVTDSTEFESSTLGDDAQEQLRAFAVALDIDPMLATQRTHLCKYRNYHHRWGDWRISVGAQRDPFATYRFCGDCAMREDRSGAMTVDADGLARQDERRYANWLKAGSPVSATDPRDDPRFDD